MKTTENSQSEQLQNRDYRKELWIAVASKSIGNGNGANYAASTANDLLASFDRTFPANKQ